MKYVILVFSLLAGLTLTNNAQAQSAEPVTAAVQKETFKVYGNCGMCKTRIEKALKDVTGIKTATWETSSKMLTVEFEPSAINLNDIHAKVAAVGHDTDKAKAPDEVYNKLHGCCKYERPATTVQ